MSGYKNSITDINGKIGIGVSNPSATLDVAGNAAITGNVTIENGDLFISRTAVNGTASRKIRFAEGINTSSGFQGGYIYYNADSNVFQIGVHNAGDSNAANDISAISIDRATANITATNITASSFIKSGGTSSQFLKANGTVDSNTYLTDITTQTDPKYLRSDVDDIAIGTITFENGIKIGTGAFGTSANRASVVFGEGSPTSQSMYIEYDGEGLTGTANSLFIGTYNNDVPFDVARFTYGGDVSFTSNSWSVNANGTITAALFVKSGGTSSQFLKADGSVDSNTYLTDITTQTDPKYLRSDESDTMAGTLTLNGINLSGVANPEITFNGSSDASVDMAIKATPEGLDFYEPEDSNKIHFQILDDLGVNSPFGYQWNGQSLDSRYLRKDVDTRGVGLTIAPTTTNGNGKIRTLFNGGSPALEFSDNAGTISADQFFAIGANDVGIGKFEIRFKSTEFGAAWDTEGTLLAEFKADNNAVSFPQGLVGIGTTDFGTTAAKLLVGPYIDSGSSAIAQFDGFLRIKDQIIIHDPVTTSAQGILAHTSAYGMYYSGSGGGSNFGIGTTTPTYKLDVSGNGRFTTNLDVNSYINADGYINTSNNFERVISAIVFPNGVANQAADIRLGNLSFWGYIEVEITSTFSNQNSAGKLTKTYSVGTNPNNLIYVNESRVVDAIGTIADNVSLGEFEWDSAISQYRIPVSHIVSTGNNYTVKIRMFTHGGGAVNVFGSISLSAVYTRTAFARNYVHYNDKIIIGGASPASSAKLTVMGNQTFGLPGNGENTSGRFISIEGNTDASGEGSSRIFFTEHNSSTAEMDNYGLSIGYRGGATSIVGASGNTWSGLADIGNGQWGFWGHNNSANGAVIMYGDRAATFVNLANNDLNNVGNGYYNGSLGIGVTSPVYKLDVAGEIGVDSYIRHNGDTDTFFGFSANDTIKFRTAGGDRLIINSVGNTVLGGHIEMQESHFINKRFDLDDVDTISPAYVILCRNAAGNDVNGTITMDRTSGLRFATKVDIIVSAGASLGPVGGLRAFGTSGNGNPSFRLVTCTYSGVSYIALEITNPDSYYETSGAYFTGRLVSTGVSLVTVAAASITSVATFEANTAHYFDGETSTTGSVGIGVTSPSYKLDVNGTGRFTGALTFAAGDRGFECAENGCISFFSNEINSGSQNVAGDLYFGWRRTNNLYFSPNSYFSNNVGIGTTSTQGILQVNGAHPGGYGLLRLVGSGACIIDMDGQGTWDTRLRYKKDGTDYWFLGMLDSSTFRLTDANNVTKLSVTQGGDTYVSNRLSIATTNFGTNAAKFLVGDYLYNGSSAIAQFNGFLRVRDQIILHSDGDTSLEGYLQCTAAGTITTGGTFRALGDVIAYASSDKQLKDNITPITNAIDKVKAISGYEFDWNNKQDVYEGHDVGVIAQEVEAVLPEIVTTRENGYKAVKYEKIVPLLIEAIKEQQKQIDELKAIIKK